MQVSVAVLLPKGCTTQMHQNTQQPALSQHRAKGKANSKPSQPGTGATGPPVAVGLPLCHQKHNLASVLQESPDELRSWDAFSHFSQQNNFSGKVIGHLILHHCSTVTACALLHFSLLVETCCCLGRNSPASLCIPEVCVKSALPEEPLPCLQHPECSTWRF